MISFIVRMRFSQEDRKEVLDAVQQLALASRQEPGCISYIPHELAGDSSLVMIYEQYRAGSPSGVAALSQVRHRRAFSVDEGTQRRGFERAGVN
jgi:quinol monooxygenase YgiN